MTYRSASRGFLYTAPPTGDRTDENRDETAEASETTEREAAEPTTERNAPELESTSAVTDANWTGTVSADD